MEPDFEVMGISGARKVRKLRAGEIRQQFFTPHPEKAGRVVCRVCMHRGSAKGGDLKAGGKR